MVEELVKELKDYLGVSKEDLLRKAVEEKLSTSLKVYDKDLDNLISQIQHNYSPLRVFKKL